MEDVGKPLKSGNLSCKVVDFAMSFGGGGNDETLLWDTDLKPHALGNYSIAVVQANSSLEDQAQVFTSTSAIFVGVYDDHS
ncbi:hypothetical protein VNO80_03470 [Phaseolus coccineus]|uniref:Uncharacterized protein n=1 Tax=Phaseolus coccineus TaxID=3886 RepID=A0AAN9RN27_PHACN